MNLKEIWSESKTPELCQQPMKLVENHKSIDMLTAFEKRIRIMFRLSIPVIVIVVMIYIIMGLYELALIFVFISSITTYMEFNFMRRIKKNRFILNLKDYLNETSSRIRSHIKYNLYSLILVLFVLVPTMYLIGVNTILKSENLLSIETVQQYPGLLVGLGISLVSTASITLLILYQVYYNTLKKVVAAQKQLGG